MINIIIIIITCTHVLLIGYAPVGGICMGGQGVSVIEESGLQTWAISAHELGHKYVCMHVCVYVITQTRMHDTC